MEGGVVQQEDVPALSVLSGETVTEELEVGGVQVWPLQASIDYPCGVRLHRRGRSFHASKLALMMGWMPLAVPALAKDRQQSTAVFVLSPEADFR